MQKIVTVPLIGRGTCAAGGVHIGVEWERDVTQVVFTGLPDQPGALKFIEIALDPPFRDILIEDTWMVQPEALTSSGRMTAQVVVENEGSEIWRSYEFELSVEGAINASASIEARQAPYLLDLDYRLMQGVALVEGKADGLTLSGWDLRLKAGAIPVGNTVALPSDAKALGGQLPAYYAKAADIPTVPVKSVAGRIGDVALTKTDVGLASVGNFKAVSTVSAQGLTSGEQLNARTNIAAGTSNFSGSYTDLSNKPVIPAAQVNADWNATSGITRILNKPTIPTVPAYSGTAPVMDGTASAGSLATISRGDHRHPTDTALVPRAAQASKVAADIDAVSVDANGKLYAQAAWQNEYAGGYAGVDLTVKFATEIAGYSDAWAWIKARVQALNLSGLHARDYIPATCTNTGAYRLLMEIAGISTYKGTGDTDTGTHIDFISRDAWPDTITYNPANYNNGVGGEKFNANGSSQAYQLKYRETGFPALASVTADGTVMAANLYTYSTASGVLNFTTAPSAGVVIFAAFTTAQPMPWLASNAYAFTNSLRTGVPSEAAANPLLTEVDYTQGGIWHYLPAELKAVVSTKRFYATHRYTAGVLLTEWSGTSAWVNLGNLWLPHELEIYGCLAYTIDTANAQYARQYPAYRDGIRKKGAGNGGSRSSSWLLSAAGNSSSAITYAVSSGIAGNANAATGIRVPVCLRILRV